MATSAQLLLELQIAALITGHNVINKEKQNRLKTGVQTCYINDIKHIEIEHPAGFKIKKGNVEVPINNEKAGLAFLLFLEEFVGNASWYTPVYDLEKLRVIREEALQVKLDLIKRSSEYQQLQTHIALLKGEIKGPAQAKLNAMTSSIDNALINLGAGREKLNDIKQKAKEGNVQAAQQLADINFAVNGSAIRFIEAQQPDRLPPFVDEASYAQTKFVGGNHVNGAVDFGMFLQRNNGNIAVILGFRPDGKTKCLLGGMNETKAVETLLQEVLEELCSRDLMKAGHPSYQAFVQKAIPVKDFKEAMLKIEPKLAEKYGLQAIFNKEFTTSAQMLTAIVDHLEGASISKDDKFHAHELATKLKCDLYKQYFSGECADFKAFLLKNLQKQGRRVQLGDNRSTPTTTMDTQPFFGLVAEQEFIAQMEKAHLTMCGGDDLLKPSITNIEDINLDGMFAEHAAIVIEGLLHLLKQGALENSNFVQQFEKLKSKNPKIEGILNLVSGYQQAHGFTGDLYLKLCQDVKLLDAYTKAAAAHKDLPQFHMENDFRHLDRCLWNRSLEESNEEVNAKPADFNQIARTVLDYATRVRETLKVDSDAQLTREQVAKRVTEVVKQQSAQLQPPQQQSADIEIESEGKQQQLQQQAQQQSTRHMWDCFGGRENTVADKPLLADDHNNNPAINEKKRCCFLV